jgi:hypothetical protein
MDKQIASVMQVIPKTTDFILWLIQKIDKFPRSQKFVLGDRIEGMFLDILEILIEANYSHEKVDLLNKANLKLEKARYLIRIAKDLHYFNIKAYEFSSRSVNEIGKMIGGWRRGIKQTR